MNNEMSWQSAYTIIEDHEHCPIDFMADHGFKEAYTNLEIFNWLGFPEADLTVEVSS